MSRGHGRSAGWGRDSTQAAATVHAAPMRLFVEFPDPAPIWSIPYREPAARALQPGPYASLPMLPHAFPRMSLRAGILGLCLGLAWAGPSRADAPTVMVSPILSANETANGGPILLPSGEAQVLVSRYEIPAGAKLPVHRHVFPRMAYVLAGTLVVTDVATGTETSYAEGGFVVEMVDAWHFGRNDGPDPVQLLVIDLAPEGQPNTVLQD